VAAWLVTLLIVGALGIWFAQGFGRASYLRFDGYSTLTRSMGFVQTGDWLTIHSNHEPVFTKPPLQYMLTALTIQAGVEPMLAVRIWPFVFTLGLLLATAWVCAGAAPAAPWAIPSAVLLLASSRVLWVQSQLALLDTGNALFVALTVGCAVRALVSPGWWVGTGIFAGMAFLQKTPLGLVAAGVIAATLVRSSGPGTPSWAELRALPGFRRGVGLAAGLSLSWPLIQLLRHGPWFLVIFVGEQWLQRFAPPNPIDEGSAFEPFRLLTWLRRDAPVTWLVALGALVAVLAVPRPCGLP